ncbi:MAG: DUF6178 family protein, partial [Nannocystaceae bacterium]
LLDRPWNFALVALSGWYPEIPQQSKPEKTRPITNLQDVARATQLIEQAAALSRLAFEPKAYGIDPVWVTRVDEPSRLTLGTLLRTAIICRELPGFSHSVALTPLSADDLAWAQANLLVGPSNALAPRLAEYTRQQLATLGLEVHAPALIESLLTRLHMELAGIERDAEGKPDLTRTGGLITLQSVGVWLKTGLTAN